MASKKDRNKKIVVAYGDGRSISEIACECGISKQRVLQVVKRAGVWARKNYQERDETIVADRRAGMSRAEVARRHGISEKRVTSITSRARRHAEEVKP